MAHINYAALIEDFKRDAEQDITLRESKSVLKEKLEAKEIRPHDFDFGKLWAECFGWQNFIECRGNRHVSAVNIMEAGGTGAVTTAAFQGISGQILYALTMEAYKSPEFKFTAAIPVRKTIYDLEKIAGITPIADNVTIVPEGERYPTVTVGETWRHAPVLKKRGFRIMLTREALFFDRTTQLQKMAADGGRAMGQNEEKRAVCCVIDEAGTLTPAPNVSALIGGHRYHYRDNSIATYGNNSGNHAWDNLSATTGLVDWTDVEAVSQLLYQMVDPDTNEPIVFSDKLTLVCGQSLELTALRIRNATEITVVTPGYATSGNPTQSKVTNPYGGRFEVLTSPYVENQMTTDTSWFYGDLSAAFENVVAWEEEMKSLGSNTQLELEQDIVQQYKWSKMSNFSTKEPRAMIAATVA